MTKILFAFVLASSFMVPHITPAVGNESATETSASSGKLAKSESCSNLRTSRAYCNVQLAAQKPNSVIPACTRMLFKICLCT